MSATTFGCPHCGKKFNYTEALKGKTVRCKCGKFFEVRPQEVSAPDNDYALVDEEIPLPPMAGESHQAPAKPAVPMMHAIPVPRLAGIEPLQNIDTPAWKTHYLPIALLIAGLAIWIFGGVLTASGGHNAHAILRIGLLLAANVAVMMLGGLLVGTLLGVEFGPLGRVSIQFSSIAVFASAVAIIVSRLDKSHSMTGPIVAWLLIIIIYWALFSLFFELDVQETLLTVSVIAVLQATLMCIMLNMT